MRRNFLFVGTHRCYFVLIYFIFTSYKAFKKSKNYEASGTNYTAKGNC